MAETLTAAPRRGPAPVRRWRGRLAALAATPPPALVTAAAVVVLATGVVARFVSSGPLWLDEAQSVDIARLPLAGLFAALRRDGSPPLYYLLLHGWISLFGTSTLAVRTLSSLVGVATLPLGWLVARRLGGRRLAWPALLLLASSPFAIRYSTEARMYQLLVLLVLAGLLVVPAALRSPSWGRLAAVSALTAALAYTHYWSFFLLGSLAGWLAWRRAWRVLAAMAAAALAYLPWLPSLVFQLRHTGTPWAPHAQPRILVDAVFGWSGPGSPGVLLGAVTLLLAFLGFAARALPGRGPRLELDLRGRPGGRLLAGLLGATLLLGVASASVLGGAFAIRYTAVVYPLWVLLLARGVSTLPTRRWQGGVLLACSVAGLWSGLLWGVAPRSQAGEVVAALAAEASPGDVVAYCPDQLAPPVHRLLPASLGLTEMTFADPTGPALVDWVNYRQRIAAADPTGFANAAVAAAGAGHTVWLVAADGYRALGDSCQAIASALELQRGAPAEVVGASGRFFEPMNLYSYPPLPAGRTAAARP